jgi:thioredoxin 1
MSVVLRSSKFTPQTLRSSTHLRTNAFAINFNVIRGFRNSAIKMGVHNLANKAEFTAALKDNNVTVLDCFAVWCGPCKVIAPQVVKFSDEFTSAHFVKLDVDKVPDVAQELNIRAMPTFLIFKGEKKVAEIVGANPKALHAAIEKAVKGDEMA